VIHYESDRVTVHHGDCLDVLRELDDNSVDAVVTDPPYGIGFMGKEWDGPGGMLGQMATGREQRGAFAYGGTHSRGYVDNDSPAFQAWCQQWAAECLRVLKPGGHLVAFGGTRTWHRLACAIEDAGFEVRDTLAYMYGSGFPKSLDVSKAIDKAARGVPQGAADPSSPNHGNYRTTKTEGKRWDGDSGQGYGAGGSRFLADGTVSDSATDRVESGSAAVVADAARWQGWGTALKPAYEPVVLARKPLSGTVAANALAWGTGALNVDGCRVGTDGGTSRGANGSNAGKARNTLHGGNFGIERLQAGRWPANVLLDHEAAAMLDEQSGESPPKSTRVGRKGGCADNGSLTGYGSPDDVGVWPGDTGGGASRFFYTAKADSDERPRYRKAGSGDARTTFTGKVCTCLTCGKRFPSPAEMACGHDGYEYRPILDKPGAGEHVAHPTVKPLDLMRWLVRLVTPPGGVVLEPFAGSGATVEACILEGFRCVAIEREADYLPLIMQRIHRQTDPVAHHELTKDEDAEPSLFDLLGGDAA
jgi:DNA modification methylase